MPQTKTDEERGYIGAWMRRERTRADRDWSDADVVARLLERGYKIRDDYYRQLEAGSGGKRPGPQLLRHLIAVFGSEPVVPPEPPAPEPQQPSDLSATILTILADSRAERAEERRAVAEDRALMIRTIGDLNASLGALQAKMDQMESGLRERIERLESKLLAYEAGGGQSGGPSQGGPGVPGAGQGGQKRRSQADPAEVAR